MQKKRKELITIEDHIIGGLGTAVCEVLIRRVSSKSNKNGNK